MPPYDTLKSLKCHHKLIITSKKGIGASGDQLETKTHKTNSGADLRCHLSPQVDEVCVQMTLGSVQGHLRCAGASPARADAHFRSNWSLVGLLMQWMVHDHKQTYCNIFLIILYANNQPWSHNTHKHHQNLTFFSIHNQIHNQIYDNNSKHYTQG